MNRFCLLFLISVLAPGLMGLPSASAQAPEVKPSTVNDIRTPAPLQTPQINAPSVFGVRPDHPLLYAIPVSGKRPMTYSVDSLPPGVQVDSATGFITGTLTSPGTYKVKLHASNDLGTDTRDFSLVVGEDLALTPPMGWNSWNCWHGGIDQDKILRSANGLVASGLNQHGWTYINIDDAWQGRRGGDLNAIQSDEKRFPNMKDLSDKVHALGLKLGIYSTPWVTSYAGHVGGSSENPTGAWDPKLYPNASKAPKNQKKLPYAIASYHFFTNDAKQWAIWGIDYLKFDWGPNEEPETKEMYDALRSSGRDIVLSLSNNTSNTLLGIIDKISPNANAWRIGGDITDSWDSLKGHGFHNDKWAPQSRPAHWNDPDMFEVGANGGGKPKNLTPDEQYTHVTQWCLLSAPLLLGCDLEHLDPFTLGLLTNDEVLAVDQDSLGKQAVEVKPSHPVQKDPSLMVFAKPMADGSMAVGLFNTSNAPAEVSVTWSDLGLSGSHSVRDLWRHKDLGLMDTSYRVAIAPHGAEMIRVK